MQLYAAEPAALENEQQTSYRSSNNSDADVAHLRKLKKYYETAIERANRTAWRLEFKDPGYSRQLDQRVKLYKQKLAEVNAQLAQKQGK